MASIPKPDPVEAQEYFQNKLNFTTGPAELHSWFKEKAPINIVDVRLREDYEQGHIPGAVNLPKGTWQKPQGLDENKTNVLYCYSQQCHLAASAALEFAKQGYPVIEMEGGFKVWKEYHLPIEGQKVAA